MNTDVLINWFESRRGKLTYSMYGSRNGTDGTADCSGAISQALKEAGVNIQGLPSTVTLPNQLAQNGFTRVSENTDWDGQRGDIILMSWGANMSQSGGSGGHVGVLEDGSTFISVDYWTGGASGQAVSSHNWDEYYAVQKPKYVEAWRYTGGNNTQTTNTTTTSNSSGRQPDSKAYYLADEVAFVNGIYQIRCDYLAPLSAFDWTDNGIPVGMVNWVDENGNDVADGADSDFKAGMYFSFKDDENNITDTGNGGYSNGYYWREFNFGQFGTAWLSVRDKDDLVNYYK